MEFERLTNCIVGLAPPFLVSCFISSLNPELRWEVQALQPMSLPQAVALAKLQEDKLHDHHKGSRPHSQPTFNSAPSTHTSNPPASPTINPAFLLPHQTLHLVSLSSNRDLCYIVMNSGVVVISANHVPNCSLRMKMMIPSRPLCLLFSILLLRVFLLSLV